MWPAIKGSMNRLEKKGNQVSEQEWSRKYRERLAHWTVDTHRTIDYLERRPDFDENQIFYLGMSHGAIFTPHTLLYEKRFKAAILYVGGFNTWTPPITDGHNYVPRITLPVLMLNGENDYLIPKKMAEDFYKYLGTSKEDKKLVFYNAGHWPLPRNEMIKETLAWIEKY